MLYVWGVVIKTIMKKFIKPLKIFILCIVICFFGGMWTYIYKDAKRENKYLREMEKLEKEKLKYEVMILKGKCNC
jgi:uncharacterized protein YhhL (DUF1145 family)